jgi:hypothetical protein
MITTTTTGLYIAYEIAKGVAVLYGADKRMIAASDQLIKITERLRSHALASHGDPGAAELVEDGALVEESGILDQLAPLLALLAHSKIKLNLRAMRDTLRATDLPYRINNVLFISPEQPGRVALSQLPRLRSFSGLAGASISWDQSDRHIEVSGTANYDPSTRPRAPAYRLNEREPSAEIAILSDGSERLRFGYAQVKSSSLLPISWQSAAPCLQIWRVSERSGPSVETLLAEVVIALSLARVSKGRL